MSTIPFGEKVAHLDTFRRDSPQNGTLRKKKRVKQKIPLRPLRDRAGISLCLFSVVIDIHCNARAADENITDNAESVRHVAEDEKAENCGENYLRIIIDRNFLCRRTDICLCYSDLPDTCENSRQNEIKKLLCRHRCVTKNEKRKEHEA